jgi:DNA-binding response OmpR family regulator
MPSGPRPSVLIVDDDELILLLLGHTLDSNGFETCSAPGGREGLRQAWLRSFDLFVLDQMMPGILGIEVAHQLTLHGRATRERIMLITAGPIPARATDYVCRVMQKPFEMAELVAALRSMIPRVNDSDPLTS